MFFLSLMKCSVIINLSVNHSQYSHEILFLWSHWGSLPSSLLTLSYHPESKVIKYLDWCNFDVLELIIPSATRSKWDQIRQSSKGLFKQDCFAKCSRYTTTLGGELQRRENRSGICWSCFYFGLPLEKSYTTLTIRDRIARTNIHIIWTGEKQRR